MIDCTKNPVGWKRVHLIGCNSIWMLYLTFHYCYIRSGEIEVLTLMTQTRSKTCGNEMMIFEFHLSFLPCWKDNIRSLLPGVGLLLKL